MSGAHAVASLLVLVLLPLLVPAALALLRGRRAPTRGVELLRTEHPRLWAEVDALATGVGTEPPDRLLAVPHVAVSITVVDVRRTLSIGLPLLAATSRVQLRALLARELARDSGGPSWVAASVCRAREVLATAVAGIDDGPGRRLLVRLVRPYLAVTAWAARGMEQAADAHAAQVVGSLETASALRRIVELELAWEALHREYVPLAVHAQRRPALVHGLHHVLGARAAALEEAVSMRLAQGSSGDDPHPPLAARLADLLAVPVRVPPDPADDTAACTLLEGGFGRLDLLEGVLHRSDLPTATWAELVARAGTAACADRTAALARVAPAAGVPLPVTLDGVLDAVGRGAGQYLIAPLVAADATPRERAAAEPRLLVQHLAAAVAHALCLTGGYVHRVDWTGPCRLTSAEDAQQVVDVEGLMAHVVADPTKVPDLRRLLERHGAVLTAELASVAAGATLLEGLASQLTGVDRRRYDLLACSTGLLVLPARGRPAWEASFRRLSARPEQAEQRRLGTLLAADLPALRALPGARWISTQEVVAGRLNRRRGGWVLEVRVRLGLPLELRSTGDTREHGAFHDAARAVLAERAGERAWQASTLGVAVPA